MARRSRRGERLAGYSHGRLTTRDRTTNPNTNPNTNTNTNTNPHTNRSDTHATRNDRTGPHGRQHGAPPDAGGHQCVAFDLDPANVRPWPRKAPPGRARSTSSSRRSTSRAAWVMVPAGAPTEQTVEALAARMQPGDIVDRRRQLLLQGRRAPGGGARRRRGIHYLDVGTSGGVWGLERGYCLMIGGAAARRCGTSSRSSGRWRRDWAASRHRRAARAERVGRTGLPALRSGRRRATSSR